MEIYFGKALVPKVCVDGVWHSVEYEGLPLICFKCGKFGHRDCHITSEKSSDVARLSETAGGNAGSQSWCCRRNCG